MRSKKLWIGGVICLIIAGAGAWFTLPLLDLVTKADEVPQSLAAADLLASGPGNNYHVQLTDYVLGKPAVTRPGQMPHREVWFPVYPRGSKPEGPPPIIFYVRAENESEADSHAKSAPPLIGMVANLLPPWVYRKVSPEAVGAFPGIDADKVWNINRRGPMKSPVYVFGGATAFFALLGLGLVVGGMMAGRRPPVPQRELSPRAAAAAAAPGNVEASPLLSRHESSFETFHYNHSFVVFAIIVFFVIGAATAFIGMGSEGSALTFSMIMFVLSGAALLSLVFSWHSRMRWAEVREAGVRWQTDETTREVSWQAIAALHRTEIINKWDFGLFVIPFRDAKIQLTLGDGTTVDIDRTVADYDILAEKVQELHGKAIYDERARDASSSKGAAFGSITLRPESVVLSGLLGETVVDLRSLLGYTVADGDLILSYRAGTSAPTEAKYPLANIPDYLVLLNLFQERGIRIVKPREEKKDDY